MELNDEWFKQLDIGNVVDWKSVSGGDINQSFELTTEDSKYFLKVQPDNDGSFFNHEVEGLELIGSVVNTPKPVKSGTVDGNGYLLTNYLEFGEGYDGDLGKMVAKMHKKHNDKFGLDHNILNAKNPKINTWQDDWGVFFVKQRLEVLVNEVKHKRYWNQYREDLMVQLEEKILDFYSQHKVEPSLLHGDLWNGNVGYEADGSPILFDPDVFYGNREMDIAMTLLFGGFGREFYEEYAKEYPLELGWEKRIPWYQTYYLLAHLNLFGEGYGTSLEGAMRKGIEY
ncbi:fructosamine kinase family protein [Companilactobacillus hulinensis]|uniref:fructosamine kinase family protein n=1 Tax=Companilactobacillus hulinensis TaxID=2486007 RepID=UPI000F7B5589|nr:fructosamine kinase family protein [Companilactobacillus hulinensis]